MKQFNRAETKDKRLSLRKNQTDAEKLLWSKLRNKQMCGYKFFRQYGIGSYIADFYCPQLKIVIEIDGGQHFSEDGKQYDDERNKFMKALDITTIRFTNLDVLINIDAVLQNIEYRFTLIFSELPPAPSLPKRGIKGEFGL